MAEEAYEYIKLFSKTRPKTTIGNGSHAANARAIERMIRCLSNSSSSRKLSKYPRKANLSTKADAAHINGGYKTSESSVGQSSNAIGDDDQKHTSAVPTTSPAIAQFMKPTAYMKRRNETDAATT